MYIPNEDNKYNSGLSGDINRFTVLIDLRLLHLAATQYVYVCVYVCACMYVYVCLLIFQKQRIVSTL